MGISDRCVLQWNARGWSRQFDGRVEGLVEGDGLRVRLLSVLGMIVGTGCISTDLPTSGY